MTTSVVDHKVWEDLQSKLDDENAVKDQLRDVTQSLEKEVKKATSALSNAQSSAEDATFMANFQTAYLAPVIQTIGTLAPVASAHPFYKYNQFWSRLMQESTFVIVFFAWCGGFGKHEGQLLSIEDVGSIMNVPVNVKDRDTFHLTIEEYLHALISLVDELARLARNSVTQGNFQRPVLISQFIKDLHAGFQLLNLKNDSLRKRNDGIKYRLREVEDVIYDLSLRDLLPKTEARAT